jgi:hypothetical protein
MNVTAKETLITELLALSKTPEPAVQSVESGIAFYNNITMIYGEAKLGKSFTVATAIKGSDALFIDVDNNGSELHKHLLKHNITPLHGVEAKPFLQKILNYEGTDRFTIVIDSFANLADEFGCNINDTRDVTKLFKALRTITDKGHALILIHHVTTNGKERGSQEYSAKIQGNAGAIFGRVDVTYILEDRGYLAIDRSRISNAANQFISDDASMLVQIRGSHDTCEIPK